MILELSNKFHVIKLFLKNYRLLSNSLTFFLNPGALSYELFPSGMYYWKGGTDSMACVRIVYENMTVVVSWDRIIVRSIGGRTQ